MKKLFRRLRPILSIFISLLPMTALAQRTPAEFHEMLQGMYQRTVPLAMPENVSQNGTVFLDTRQKAEYEVSHIPGARFIAYDDFDEDMVEDLPRDTSIVVYCSVGYRSERIGEKLTTLGFTNVQNLYGGIFWWMHSGLPVEDAHHQPTDSVHTYNRRWSQWAFTGEKVW